MEQFLKSVERKAFLMARYAVSDDEEALDIVQDAMLKLVERYGERPEAEWRPLFWRILRNRIQDTHRRRSALGRLMAMAGFLSVPAGAAGRGKAGDTKNDEAGPSIEAMAGPAEEEPPRRYALAKASQQLEQALRTLPTRQREAFLLREWEGLSVNEAAKAMGCSEGSVKTHHFRALKALREQLAEHWP